MAEKILILLVRMATTWALTGWLLRSLATEYHLPPPSWSACLLMVLLLDSVGKILRGELLKVDE